MDNFASILESNVFTTLRTFLLTLVGCPVIRVPVNRVAMPLGDFIAMSPGRFKRLGTNTDEVTGITTETTLMPTEITIQLDCYGDSAMDRATSISALFRDSLAVESFELSGFDIAPLYATDPQQMPLSSGEDQYIERWMFECVMQFNPVVTSNILTTSTGPTVGIVNVDRTYPA